MSKLLEHYEDIVAGRMDDSCERLDNVRSVSEAMKTIIYGELVRDYVNSALGIVEGRENPSGIDVEAQDVARAIGFLSEAARRSEREYVSRRPTILENVDFLQEIDDLKVNVAHGVIDLLSDRYAMVDEEGRAQVDFADIAFTSLGTRAQLLMSGLNYATFTGKTMLTGESLLSGGEELDLTGWTERQVQESMPHLALSNMAIGQIISDLLQKGRTDELFSIIDTGSGTGCTLAGSVLGVCDAVDNGYRADKTKLNIVGIEGSQSFFKQLAPFLEIALEKLRTKSGDLNFFGEILNSPQALELVGGKFSVTHGDILQTLKNLRFSKEAKDGVVVVTANYVWHRLPRVIKDALIKEISTQAPNVIFLVADLVQNSSAVNKGYFNFRDNGLLNCGNVGLRDVFEINGFRVMDLNEKTAPATMDQSLAMKIGEGPTSDSIFYMAYRGKRAAGLIEG